MTNGAHVTSGTVGRVAGAFARATFWGAKPITRVMDERERSDLTGRLRKAAEKMPYPYFLRWLQR